MCVSVTHVDFFDFFDVCSVFCVWMFLFLFLSLSNVCHACLAVFPFEFIRKIRSEAAIAVGESH